MVSGEGLLRISARKLQNVQRNHGENIPRKIPATEGPVDETLGSCNVQWERKLSQNSRDVLSVGTRCNRSKWSGQTLQGPGNGNRESELLKNSKKSRGKQTAPFYFQAGIYLAVLSHHFARTKYMYIFSAVHKKNSLYVKSFVFLYLYILIKIVEGNWSWKRKDILHSSL